MSRDQLKIEKLIWDTWNKEHIKKHGVSVGEVNSGIKHGRKVIKNTYNNRLLVLVELKTRLLSVVLNKDKAKDKRFYVVTARDMSKEERVIFKNEYPQNATKI